MYTDRTRTYSENPLGGTDFVAGDVHGCFRTLERAMEAVDFNPERDRLFAVGDLVNRARTPTRPSTGSSARAASSARPQETTTPSR